MASTPPPAAATATATAAAADPAATIKNNSALTHYLQRHQEDKRQPSIFEVPGDFFDSCRLLQSPYSSIIPTQSVPSKPPNEDVPDDFPEDKEEGTSGIHPSEITAMQRWACSTCDAEFESLLEQRSHFSSDFHRLNVKLTVAGKGTVKEEDFDETSLDTLCKDFDVSSISGSDDEDENETGVRNRSHSRSVGNLKNKMFIQLQNGERVSFWKCLLLNESENIAFENDKLDTTDDGGCNLQEKDVTEKLKKLVDEPRNGTCLRVVLLSKGGHFAGCVFDGNTVIAHKTFHRYVVRAKAGKRQSSKDASGKTIHSAGSSLRRYNELALKKEIQVLLAAWKLYFAASCCVFISAPSYDHQIFFDGKRPIFNCPQHLVRNIPLTVGRPTLKEAHRLYKLLTQIYSETDEEFTVFAKNKDEELFQNDSVQVNGQFESSRLDIGENSESNHSSILERKLDSIHIVSDSESERENISASTPLHEAAKSGNPQEVLDLLEQGLDPCIKDEKGRTPYMLATEKEVRDTFRRFMAMNLDKWDWHAAKVPSALTKEMEESQATKQAEKEAKRKARAKELKKLRKAKAKKAQAEAAQSQNASSSQNRGSTLNLPKLSKEEELKRAQDAEREKRAAAAERRMAALKAESAGSVAASSGTKTTGASDIICSCCRVSLAGIVPFHRYSYKYCSTTCMHLHKEILEDG
ncbi:OLC1v1038949C3 [Oldenlandia corymbosa var. corymbosa]|nr:OLC1v1038949C3 [Oldenlandia corymbosa var. corymbosa]